MRTVQNHGLVEVPGLNLLRKEEALTLIEKAELIKLWWGAICRHSVLGANGVMPSFASFLKEDAEGFNCKVTPDTDEADYSIRPWSTEWGLFLTCSGVLPYTNKERCEKGPFHDETPKFIYRPAYEPTFIGLMRRGGDHRETQAFAIYKLAIPERNGLEANDQPIVARLTSVKQVNALGLISPRPSCDEPLPPYIDWHCLLDFLFLWIAKQSATAVMAAEQMLALERKTEAFIYVYNLHNQDDSFISA